MKKLRDAITLSGYTTEPGFKNLVSTQSICQV